MSSLVRYAKSNIFKLVYKHNNYLVYFSGLLNCGKTEVNTVVKGSLIVNMGRGLERVNNCTLLERSSSIPRIFLFVCLFVWHRLLFITWGGGGGQRTLFESELNLPDTAPLYAPCYSNDPPSWQTPSFPINFVSDH